MDAAEAARIRRELEEMNRLLQKGGDLFEKLLKGAGVELGHIKGKVDEIGEAGEEAMVDIGVATEDYVDLAISKFDELDARLGRFRDEAKREFEALERTPFFKVLAGDPDRPGLISGARGGGAMSTVTDLQRNLFSGTAFGAYGGIIGLLLTGYDREQTLRAGAAQALAVFEQVSSGAKQHIGDVAGRSAGLQADLFTNAEEFKTVFTSMSAASVGPTSAFETFDNRVRGFGHTVAEATIAYDKLYQVGVGFTAQAAAKLVEDTGRSFGSAAMEVAKMEHTAQAAGINVRMFVDNIMQATSALRLHRQETDDVVRVYHSMSAAVEQMFPGSDKSFIAKSAAGALSGLPGFIQGASKPFQALIGREMFGSEDPFENIFRLQTAAQDKNNKDFLSSFISATQGLVAGVQASSFAKMELLQQQGMPAELARIFLQISEDTMQRGMSSEEVLSRYGADLSKALSNEFDKRTPFERFADEIKGAVAALGNLLLQVLTSILRVLISGFGAILYLDPDIFKKGLDISHRAIVEAGSKLGDSASSLEKAGFSVLKSVYLDIPFTPESVGKKQTAGQKARSEIINPVNLLEAGGNPALALTIGGAKYLLRLVVKPEITEEIQPVVEHDPTNP